MDSLVIGLCAVLSLITHVVSKNVEPMQTFTVDLDRPPEERWIDLLSHYNSSVPAIVKYFDQLAPSKLVQELLEKICADLDTLLGDLGKEMKSVADYWKIDLGIVVSLNFAYELRRVGGGHPTTTGNVINSSHVIPASLKRESQAAYYSGQACTSIVAQDETGSTIHGRNLDWNLPDDLRNMTSLVKFVKGGKVVFTGVTTAGYVGILTGMSNAGFSISINERNLGGSIIEDSLEAILLHSWCPTHLARQVLTESASYAEALSMLERALLTAPAYFIMAGKQAGKGAVVTRDRNFLTDLWALNFSVSVPNSWYILETNYDHWKSPLSDDDRRHYGNLYMQTAGQKEATTMTGMYTILQSWPVANIYTTYTCLMKPITNTIEAYNVFI